MNENFTKKTNSFSKLGFHYFPDTLHYKNTDITSWIPELQAMGTSYLVIHSSIERAIPENFIRSLINAQIEPLIIFDSQLDTPPEKNDILPIMEAYARWGVHGIILFDKPNDRSAWKSSGWLNKDLVDSFLDRYIPLATLAHSVGLNPILPPLEPGGSYWDTAFLRSTLETLEKRGNNKILDKLVLSAYAWTHNHALDWGVGGPQRWPEAKPYFTPQGSEDNRGFRIFEWYNAITQAILQQNNPIILLGAGANHNPQIVQSDDFDPEKHAQVNQDIINLLSTSSNQTNAETNGNYSVVPNYVVACNFWLLAAETNSPYHFQGWFQEDSNLPIVNFLQSQIKNKPHKEEVIKKPKLSSIKQELNTQQEQKSTTNTKGNGTHPITHYLLLPTYDWGIADWHLDVIRPFVKKHQPTIGFSVEEAKHAQTVTVVGNQETFSENIINQLRQAGCTTERISGDGTSIATQLSER